MYGLLESVPATNPDDERASVLLERIAADKGNLIAEGEIEQQKWLPEISIDEKPFDMHAGWLTGEIAGAMEAEKI